MYSKCRRVTIPKDIPVRDLDGWKDHWSLFEPPLRLSTNTAQKHFIHFAYCDLDDPYIAVASNDATGEFQETKILEVGESINPSITRIQTLWQWFIATIRDMPNQNIKQVQENPLWLLIPFRRNRNWLLLLGV